MDVISAVFRIIIIDLVLSGDNAVVIGMAAHRLPPPQRRAAILIGGTAAIALRIGLTTVALFLLGFPGLQFVGGLLLIWIAFKLLSEEEESHEGVKVAANMKQAITTILIADLVMSLDNVLGVAAASRGSIVLLAFGLILSMAVLMFLGSLIAMLINKLWWLAYLGSGVIAWTGAIMLFEDPFVYAHVHRFSHFFEYIAAAVITMTTLLFAHWFHRVHGSSD
jgi:YjbE family integral membrane protein